ncbi:hypothetical protein [Microtetraspora niveoalba]|uniref:hypothetical protein n=1 Tax=Microtetraspora niveoalba TaxID=46175 RepID=UPI000B1420E4|nr:hypothetical protein [Microtetraspora niveoalba]
MKQVAAEVPHARYGLNPQPSGWGARQKWFAGPVFASADNLCVQMTGAVRIGSKPLVRGGTPQGKWAHCG